MTEPTAVVEAGGFESPRDTSLVAREAGAAAALAREEAEIKAAIFLARQSPRDELAAHTRLMRACRRPSFAEGAQYRFPRGGQNIKGPSVQLAREAARCWGNIRYGVRVVSIDADTVHIRGYAHDMETNAYVDAEDKFARLVQKKGPGPTKWVPPDERELRELTNRRGAILYRNCILQIVPSDLVEDAIREAETTMVKAANGELQQSRDETIRRLAVAFDLLGVSLEMLETKLGHPLENITPSEIGELRGIYNSIRDGNSRVAEHFDLNAGAKVPTESNQELNARLAQEEPASPAPEPPTQPAPAPPSKATQEKGAKAVSKVQSSLV